MDNPFRYGEVVTGSYFTNRAAELAELEADVRNGQNVVIISPRRYGKTSLVSQAVEHLKQEQVLIAYLDLFRTPTKDRFADHLADAIYRGLVAPWERLRHQAVGVFQKLPIQPKVTINPDGTPSFEFTAGEREKDYDRTIEELLALPGTIAKDRQRRVALILDEFQEVVSIDPHLPALMRAIFQLQAEVAHIFLGSRRHLMERVFTDQNEPMYRLAKPLLLREISRHDFAAFIRFQFTTTGPTIADDAVERLLDITEGHPHDTQELGYFAWSISRGEGVPVTRDLVDRALGQVVEAENARYTAVWEQLSAHQRLVLTALIVDGGREVLSEAYRRRNRIGTASTVQKSLARLTEREIIEFSAQGSYRVPDVFLRAWVMRMTAPRTFDPN